MKAELFKMLKNTVGSRKFMFGLPTLIVLLCWGKLTPEWFIAGFIALFAANSYDKKVRNGKQGE